MHREAIFNPSVDIRRAALVHDDGSHIFFFVEAVGDLRWVSNSVSNLFRFFLHDA